MNAVHQEIEQPPNRRIHHRILWGMFTGDEPYRDLFWLSLSPRALSGLISGWSVRNEVAPLTSTLDRLPEGGQCDHHRRRPRRYGLCLALHRLTTQIGRRIQITLIEGKQFAGERHYNQCAGVLSPPLAEILEGQLDVPFPYHLSRGEIPGYVLHADSQKILLEDTVQPAIALRRVQFDAYMLETAVQRGSHSCRPCRGLGVPCR